MGQTGTDCRLCAAVCRVSGPFLGQVGYLGHLCEIVGKNSSFGLRLLETDCE